MKDELMELGASGVGMGLRMGLGMRLGDSIWALEVIVDICMLYR